MSAPGGRGDMQASVGCRSTVVISVAKRGGHVKEVLHGGPLTVCGACSPFVLRDSSLNAALAGWTAMSSPAVYSASSTPPLNRRDISDRPTSVRRTPSNSQSFESNTPDAPSGVARVGLTAPAACTPSGRCDDEPPQAHRWVRV